MGVGSTFCNLRSFECTTLHKMEKQSLKPKGSIALALLCLVKRGPHPSQIDLLLIRRLKPHGEIMVGNAHFVWYDQVLSLI